MAHKDYTTKKRRFQHLTLEKRTKIETLLQEGYTQAEIGRRIGVHRATVCREQKRGTVRQLNSDLTERQEYFAETGTARYRKNRKNSRRPFKIAETADFIEYADKKMNRDGWSPDAVCGRAAVGSEWKKEEIVCAKTLYNYIEKGLLKTRNIDLLMKVKRKPKKKRERKNKKILGKSIEERPKSVESREEFGHWEIDSVIGKKGDKTAVLTIVERKTRAQIAVKAESRQSAAVDRNVQEILKNYGERAACVFRSITGDNGSEFSTLSETLKNFCHVYFCHPYSSFEKGTNERHNGLLRRFVKKGKSIDDMPPSLIKRAAERNNSLPRRILGYRTPAEAFAEELEKITLLPAI